MATNPYMDTAIAILQGRVNDLDCVKMDLNHQDIDTKNIDNQIDYLKAHIRSLNE